MWKKRKKEPPKWQLRFGAKVGQQIGKVQLKWAAFMNARTKNWSRSRQITALVLFMFGMISFSSYLLSRQARPPAAGGMPGEGNFPKTHLAPPSNDYAPRLTPSEKTTTLQFLHTVDSLAATPAGRDTIALFNKLRPGFIDSVRQMADQLGWTTP